MLPPFYPECSIVQLDRWGTDGWLHGLCIKHILKGNTLKTSSINRRTLVKGAAWVAPAVAATAMIPAYAASPGQVCVYDRSFVSTAAITTNGSNYAYYTIQNGGTTYKVEINVAKGSGTGSTRKGSNLEPNMDVTNQAWNGNQNAPDGSRDAFYTIPSTGLTLNQIGVPDNNPGASLPVASPVQTATFRITDASTGQPVELTNLKITLKDVSSVDYNSADPANARSWREVYWDQISFDQKPDSINPSHAAVGAGTVSSPFQRASNQNATSDAQSTGGYADVFTFNNVADGTVVMNYGSGRPDGTKLYGWQAIQIYGVSFTAKCQNGSSSTGR